MDYAATSGAIDIINYLTGNKWEANDEHMGKTPGRFVQALYDLTHADLRDINSFTTFDSNGHDEMIVVQDIQFVTLCAHHMLPFHGVAHVAYIPDGRICGLSKIPRAVRFFSKAMTVQELLTTEIADFLEGQLEPLGIAVVMKAEHMCMTIRGVQAAGTLTTTSAMRGVFADHSRQARSEFLGLIQ